MAVLPTRVRVKPATKRQTPDSTDGRRPALFVSTALAKEWGVQDGGMLAVAFARLQTQATTTTTVAIAGQSPAGNDLGICGRQALRCAVTVHLDAGERAKNVKGNKNRRERPSLKVDDSFTAARATPVNRSCPLCGDAACEDTSISAEDIGVVTANSALWRIWLNSLPCYKDGVDRAPPGDVRHPTPLEAFNAVVSSIDEGPTFSVDSLELIIRDVQTITLQDQPLRSSRIGSINTTRQFSRRLSAEASQAARNQEAWRAFDFLQREENLVRLRAVLFDSFVFDGQLFEFLADGWRLILEICAVSSSRAVETTSSCETGTNRSEADARHWGSRVILAENSADGVLCGIHGALPLYECKNTTRVALRPPLLASIASKPHHQPANGTQSEKAPLQKPLIGMSRVGGLASTVAELLDIFVLPWVLPGLFQSFRIRPPKGILLHGPPGTGKTLLAAALAEELQLRWETLCEETTARLTGCKLSDEQAQATATRTSFENRPAQPEACVLLEETTRIAPLFEATSAAEILGHPDGAEEAVYNLFERCAEKAATGKRGVIVFVDEIDAVCPDRTNCSEAARRLVAAFLTALDGLNSDSRVVLLAATNRPHALDPALRRAGRIDREILIDVPNADDRDAIFRKQLSEIAHSLTEAEIKSIGADCQAFVGADIKALCTFAALLAVKEAAYGTSALSCHRAVDTYPLRTKTVDFRHFLEALKHVRPSGMKSMAIDIPAVKWTDIGGYENVKEKLKESVEWPIKYRELFQELKVRAPRGVLLYGPPGCSKTLLAKAVATESKMNFIAVKGPELFSKYVGDSERAVRDVFSKARQNAPCVIFFDEIDSLGGDRESSEGASGVEARVLSQMLNEMDGIGELRQVYVIGATNRPDLLDSALLRPGRLDRIVYVPLPDVVCRRQILAVHLRDVPLGLPAETGNQRGTFVLEEGGDVLPESNDHKSESCARLGFIREMAEMTEGYTGAELEMVCREAALLALRELLESLPSAQGTPNPAATESAGRSLLRRLSAGGGPPPKPVVEWRHALRSLEVVRPRIPASLIRFYEEYNQNAVGRVK